MRSPRLAVSIPPLLVVLAACAGDVGEPADAAAPIDGSVPRDAAPPDAAREPDAGARDASAPPRDAGSPSDDAGPPPVLPRLEIRGRTLGVLGRDGRFRAALPTGDLPLVPVPAGQIATMAATGRNLVYIQPGAGGPGADSARLYAGGDLSAGWNEAQWARLEADLETAAANDVGVMVDLWGTVALECDAERDGRWFRNPWNADVGRGGPYDVPDAQLCGKRAFYHFERFGETVYSPGAPYPASASMAVRGQWRQEELVHRLATLLRDHPHASIFLMWEAHDFGTHVCGACGAPRADVMAWHQHLTDYIHAISPDTLVSTGVDSYSAVGFATDSGVDFLEDEGGNMWRERDGYCDRVAPLGMPLVWTGFLPFDDANAECRRGWNGCARAQAIDNVHDLMHEMWSCGVQASFPFWEYRYDIAADFDPYAATARAFLDGVATWADEPGDEVRPDTFPAMP